jgi:hypothetical protein
VLKSYSILLLFILSCAMGQAVQRKADPDSTAIIITLNNNSNQNKPVDSVFIILDRYDRTGAGIVRQVFYPVNNKIAFSIPKGKYFVDIFCLGAISKEHFGKIINANSNRNSKMIFKLRGSAPYTPGLVSIPQEKVNFARLSILKSHSYK